MQSIVTTFLFNDIKCAGWKRDVQNHLKLDDVLKLTCGKTRGGAVEGAKHSQGLTIDCLSQKLDSVSAACRKEMETVAEMQADDFHLDRALYLACNQVTYYLVPR